jgi:putative ABC transport system substrate-binding protein
MKRRDVVALLGVASMTASAAVRAQQRRLKVAFLYPGFAGVMQARIDALVAGAVTTGLRADQLEIAARTSDGEASRLPGLARELVAEKPDVIVAVTAGAVRAALAADASLPVVAHDLEADPIALGLIKNYAQPGGRVTGVFFDFPEFRGKWVEMMRECIPGLSRVAVLWDPSTSRNQLDSVIDAAKRLQLETQTLEVRAFAEFEDAYRAAARAQVQAVLALSSPLHGTRPAPFAEITLRHRLPTISLFADFARAGGLIAYGPHILETYHLVGLLVGKILRGAKPANLPVERPGKHELVVNVKTAKALGLVIPASILVRADEVIE